MAGIFRARSLWLRMRPSQVHADFTIFLYLGQSFRDLRKRAKWGKFEHSSTLLKVPI